MRTIGIVNYGMGNLGSISNALKFLGGAYFVSGSAQELAKADAYILPGVGAFAAAMNNLRQQELVEMLTDQVIGNTKPFLGICLGMQLLAEDSTEYGFTKGLGWISGHVVELAPSQGLRLPHVGWNNVRFTPGCPLFANIEPDAAYYFDHGYHLTCSDEMVVARCDYGGLAVAGVRKGNVFGVQFHPEKSQRNGLKMLRNFLNFVTVTHISEREAC